MITTCTLNPAIDKFSFCKNFTLNEVNNIKSYKENIGGKGINVAIVLKNLGLNVTACGLIGKKNSQIFTQKLNSLGIENKLIQLEGSTRVNIKIETENGTTTDINFPSINCSQQDIKNVIKTIKQSNSKYIILGGSLPQSLPKDTYFNLINEIKNKNNKIILDSSKKALKLAICNKLYMIKPNILELEEIYNQKFSTIQDVINTALEIVNQGVKNVIVSLGKDGALFVNNKQVIKIKASKQSVVNTVGAGDTLVASFIGYIAQNKSFLESAKFAVAMSAFSVTKRDIEIKTKDINTAVNDIFNKLEVIHY